MRRHSMLGLPLLALLVLSFAGVPAADAGAPALSEKHRDKVHKFSFPFFKGWKPVPLEPGEKTTVVKYRDPKNKGQNRGTYDPDLVVVRIVKDKEKAKPAVTGEGDGNEPPSIDLSRFGFKEPEDAWDATIGEAARMAARMSSSGKVKLKKDKCKKIKSKDKPAIEGKLWVEDVPYPSMFGEPIKMHMVLASFEKEGVEYGVFMTCGEPLKKHYSKAFIRIAKSFKYFDAKAEDVESLDDLDGVNITPRRRADIEKGLVEGWAVIVSPKQNYIVIYNTKNNKNHALAKEIAKRIELIREQVYEVQFPPAKPITAVSIVRVCADRQEYHAYGGPGGSAGYWSSGTEELVFYDASRAKKIDDDTVSVLYHEAFHQYIYYSVGDVAPHSWFNEGHGDYYAGAKYNGGKFVIKPFEWRRGVIRTAVAKGPREKEILEDGNGKVIGAKFHGEGYTPLEDLVRFTQREYYSYPSVCYAQGWSLIYFLREIVPKKKKWNEKWGHILQVYFDTLKAEVNKEGDGPMNPFDRPEPDLPTPEDGDEKDGDDDEKDGDDGNGEDDGDEDEGEEKPPGIPRTFFRGRGGAEALKKAVDKAFEGVDWEEFEQAWLKKPAG